MQIVKEIKGQGEPPKGRLVADLDKLISEPTFFKLHGKWFEMKPVSTQNFFVITNGLAEIWARNQDGKVIEYEESVDLYLKLFSSCIDITREEIEKMTQAQVVALAQQVVDHAKGSTHVKKDDGKKKENLT